jgi:hypothetical protein
MITVQLLGGAYLRSGDVPIHGPPAQRHRIALLTLIVAAWPQPLSRDRAMALLWPERDLGNARRLLNLAVHVLRYTLWLGQLCQAYAMAGQATRAREILRELEERAQGAYVSPYHFAYACTGLGDVDRAMDWLERAVAERAGPAYGIKGSFLFTPLRAHPRFQALLRQMNLA